MDEYRLVVFGDDWDVYQTAYRSLIENPSVYFISTFRPKGMLGQLQRLQFNPRLNSICRIPFKEKWNPYYLRNLPRQRGSDEEKLCFLILENWLRVEGGIRLLPYLRSHYPEARIVCFTQDLIATIEDHYTRRPIDVDYIKRYVDLWISYDLSDVRKYDLVYHPTVFSPTNIVRDESRPRYDLYFLGRDKGRLPLLVAICKAAKEKGISCLFLLVEVPKEKQIVCDGIQYIDYPVTYQENLQNCANSHCVLELLQQDAVSPSFRVWECISLNRKLLTNNRCINQQDVYDDRYVSMFQTVDDIDWHFVSEDVSFPEDCNPYLDDIRPENLVSFIDKQLNIKIRLS